MHISEYLQQITNENGYSICYHSLRGNLYVLNPVETSLLNSIAQHNPLNLTSHQPTLNEFTNAGYIVEKRDYSRRILSNKNKFWMEKTINGGQLKLLNLMISEVCNFACKHCLHKCSVDANPTHGNKKLMDFSTAKMAFDAYKNIMHQNDQKKLNIHFGSAEPLLNWKVLRQIIKYIRQNCKNASITINTNLSLLNLEMAKFFKENTVYISTSLDGPIMGNDAIRILPNGQGTFSTILEKIQLLNSIKYPLDGFSITLNDLNFDLVTPDFIHWAYNQGFKGIATDIDLINVTNANRSIEDCVKKLMDLRKACLEHAIETFGTWTTAYHNLLNEPEDDMPTFCKAVKGQNLSINAEGKIFVCGHTTTPIGNLTNMQNLFRKSNAYYQLVESRLPGNNKECVGCPIEGICAGQCQITREISNLTGNQKDKTLCKFYRLATRELLKEKLGLEIKILEKEVIANEKT